MILSLLKSKAGVVIVTVLICGVFFALSKWKHRTQTEASDGRGMTLRGERSIGSADMAGASLLRKTQEKTRARAVDVERQKKAEKETGSSYDEVGDVYRRRPVPEPIARTGLSVGDGRDSRDSPDDENGNASVVRLRIHGRKMAQGAKAKIVNAVSSLMPGEALPSGGHDPLHLSAPAIDGPPPERFVPFGRLIKAELVITLESTQDEMPLIGLVVEPVYNNGKLVIPAGTELHSMARPDRVRDRIISTTQWRMVFPREGQKPNGRQLTFDGIALDREDRDGNGFTWSIADGSYGLRGRALRNAQTQETLMLFAAEALKAASSSMMDRQQTVLGEQVQANARNAALAGGQAVLDHFAAGIAKEVERNGVYIQVPAGKQFYVYPRQVIDPDRAGVPSAVARIQ
ncbi:MAG TPA: TrbI/VirB10 family protein [Opitutaceae bacterium]|nr:TrbI/VirB10 family protein [Opitutaceae bacterium]